MKYSLQRGTDLSESDIASVRERGDDQAGSVAEILVVVTELSIADVGKAVVDLRVPPANRLNSVTFFLVLERLGFIVMLITN